MKQDVPNSAIVIRTSNFEKSQGPKDSAMVLKLLAHGLNVRPQDASLAYIVAREVHPNITGAHIRRGTDADATPGIVNRFFGRALGGDHQMQTRRKRLNDFYDDRSPYYFLLRFIL